MFSSEDCVYCPPIEMIVREVVGSGMQEMVHVSTIDVDDDPEAKKQYNVMALPTLVINDEIVLEGGMDDDSVREILWSTLLNQAVSSEEAVSQTKKSLLSFTMNIMDSLNGTRVIRPSVGDYTHIGDFQLNLLSLYSLDPLIPHLLYKAGYQLGLYGVIHHSLTLLHPKIGKTAKPNLKFKHLAYSLQLFFSDREILPTLLAKSAVITELTPTKITILIEELASASLRINVGENMCDFIAGQLAGVTEAVMGVKAGCRELTCLANNSDYCTFEIGIGEDAIERLLPPLENKDERAARRQNFYEVIHETTEIISDSLLMRKILRSNIGDFMHISVFQPIIISLKLLDKFSSSILYSGGRELGVFGPGKPLLYKLVKEKGVDVPLNLSEGVELLYEYLSHPTYHLGRNHGLVRLHRNNDNYMLEVEENSSISGMGVANMNKTFCDFQAGFFAGRLHILIGKDPTVKEIECQGMGSKNCKFLIKVNE